MAEQPQRIEDLLTFVRKLQREHIGDNEKTSQLARFLNNPYNAPAKDHTDFQALLANFQWQRRTKTFKQSIQIDNFEKALLVIKEMLDDGSNQEKSVVRWVCSACTYSNHPDFMLCEMCQTAKILDTAPEPVKLDAWQSSLTVGSRLDVLDCENEWVPAEVVKETQKGGEIQIRVHYIEWDDNWDEWISLPSVRISKFGSHKWKWRYPAGFHKSKRWEVSVYSHLSKPKKKKKHSPNGHKHSSGPVNPPQLPPVPAKKQPPQQVLNGSQSSEVNVKKHPKKVQETPVAVVEKEKPSENVAGKDDEVKVNGLGKVSQTSVGAVKPSSVKPKPDKKDSPKAQTPPQKPIQISSLQKPNPSPEPKKDEPKPKLAKANPNPEKSHKGKRAKPQTGPVDEWDMCDEFGADMLKCSVCGENFFDVESHMMDFVCPQCDSKEIQEGYAIVVPDE